MFRFLGAAVVALTLSIGAAQAGPFAGFYDEDSGHGLEAVGHPFHQTLYQGYEALSDDRNGSFDTKDGEHFNHKARAVARRSGIHSDAVMDRKLAQEEKMQFFIARDRLHTGFDKGARELAPVEIGTAQVAFDCWIEATEGNREDDADECRQRFEEAMAAAEAKANYEIMVITFDPPAIPELPPQVEEAAAPAPIPPQEYYIVYFEFDSTVMTTQGEENMRRAIRDLQDIDSLKIALRAHADKSGSNDYNMDLSRRRAEAVLTRLVSANVDTERLRIVEAVGEDQSLVETPDGQREQGNRAVEIDLRQ